MYVKVCVYIYTHVYKYTHIYNNLNHFILKDYCEGKKVLSRKLETEAC